MLVLDLALYALLGSALLFSIIELGLSAYVVSLYTGASYSYYDPTTGRYVSGGSSTAPSWISFILFCSIWTILVVVGLTVFAFMHTRSRINRDHSRWFAPLTLAVNALTMIFWLAAFATMADLYRGVNPQGVPGALLAFGVLLWLIFLALLILNILTAVSVLKSERVGYPPLHSRSTVRTNNNMAQV